MAHEQDFIDISNNPDVLRMCVVLGTNNTPVSTLLNNCIPITRPSTVEMEVCYIIKK